MSSLRHIIPAFAAALSVVSGLAHDQVKPYPQTVPDDKYGELYLRYKPFLEVDTGCVPFPAVQDDGQVNDGLNNSGAMDGECGDSEGQVYVRSKTVEEGLFGIMYYWYMPKDQNVDGPGNLGHRHEWEGIVVWLSSGDMDAQYKGISASAHDGFSKDPAGGGGSSWDGDRPLIEYLTKFGNHELAFSSQKGGEQPLVAWESMSDAARNALNTYDFGDANCAINDANFDSTLSNAKL